MKIKDSFNDKTGIAKIILQTKNGSFTGIAKIHPDDKPYSNKFFGLVLAEIRAYIKSLKKEISITKTKRKAIYSLKKDYVKDEFFNKLPKTIQKYIFKKLDEHLSCYSNIIDNKEQEINLLKEEIINKIKIKDKLNLKIKDKIK